MTNTTPFTPDWVSAPGDTIEDLLEERGWSKREFAERIGFTPKHVNDLTKGLAPISADAAERLARVLGSTTRFWLTRDAHYQAGLEHQRAIEEAREDADWLKELPLSWMKKQGWVESFKDKGKQVLECLGFFGVHSVDAWQVRYEKPLVAFRASEKFDKQVGAVAAWLRRAEVEATAVECEPFDKQGFTKELQSLRSLTCEPNPEQFIPELKKRCARHGVAVVFIAAPSGCPASGATKWLGSEKAMLVLSLRYKTNDHLWFTFFHEVGHLLKHGKRMFFIEGLEGLDLEAEEQANRFARDLLIPPSSLQALYDLSRKPYLSKQDVADFARSIHVAPGIVVGRMQHEDWLPQSHMNKLKERYQWAASN